MSFLRFLLSVLNPPEPVGNRYCSLTIVKGKR